MRSPVRFDGVTLSEDERQAYSAGGSNASGSAMRGAPRERPLLLQPSQRPPNRPRTWTVF